MALKHHFPSSLGTVLKALKGGISKVKSDFQSYNNHDKRLVFFINQQISIVVPENMVYGSPENMKKAGHPRHPVVHGGLPSGPRQINPAVHNQTQPQKQSAAAPAVMGDEGDDEEDEARAEKTKKSPMAAQIKWSTAAPTETEIITKAEKTREVCHGHHHSRAVTTTAQHSGGPCSSTSQNLGSTVWR
uniref:Uncharacterized protein n=1 Tax=Fagus sylvatica TaxID=28930 RepID=A0A2N9HCK7_FAGSY